MGDDDPGVAAGLDERARRQRRSQGYLGLWRIEADTASVPAPVEGDARPRPVEAVVGRLLALTVVGLKGQGLTQAEAFAFADAYGVWDALNPSEHDFVLDPSPLRHDVVQAAWRFEGVWVLLWSLGHVRHLAFPDRPCDSGRALELVVAHARDADPSVRPVKDLLDAADVHDRLARLCAVARAQGMPAPSGLDQGVVHERDLALRWVAGLDAE